VYPFLVDIDRRNHLADAQSALASGKVSCQLAL
jgi:hypothetical protein